MYIVYMWLVSLIYRDVNTGKGRCIIYLDYRELYIGAALNWYSCPNILQGMLLVSHGVNLISCFWETSISMMFHDVGGQQVLYTDI
jgi:hypothetical protein